MVRDKALLEVETQIVGGRSIREETNITVEREKWQSNEKSMDRITRIHKRRRKLNNSGKFMATWRIDFC